jgi:RimJ/RimL family protein N-acetyltransferase
MKAVRTYDNELVARLMRLPELWATVAEDGQNPDLYVPDCENACWLLMIEGEELVGLYNLHAHNSVTVEIHAHVFPEFRKKHSYDTGIAALSWVIDNSDYQKVVAVIPTIYLNVKRFTCSFGFKEEGVNRKSYLKSGELVDQWLLGITRDEILQTLQKEQAA